MDIPETIKILNFTYQVSDMSLEDFKEAPLYGKHSSPNLKMYFDPTQPAEQLRDTLLHECLHAIINAYNLPIDREEEEEFVTLFSPALIRFFDDNTDLALSIAFGDI